jgi:hypothetical protein
MARHHQGGKSRPCCNKTAFLQAGFPPSSNDKGSESVSAGAADAEKGSSRGLFPAVSRTARAARRITAGLKSASAAPGRQRTVIYLYSAFWARFPACLGGAFVQSAGGRAPQLHRAFDLHEARP